MRASTKPWAPSQLLAAVSIGVAIFGLSGCGGGGGADAPAAPAPVPAPTPGPPPPTATQGKLDVLASFGRLTDVLSISLVPVTATTDFSGKFVAPATFCKAGAASVTVDGSGPSVGSTLPAGAHTVAASFTGCTSAYFSQSTIDGAASLRYDFPFADWLNASQGSGSFVVTADKLRVNRSGTAAFDLTVNGALGFNGGQTTNGSSTSYRNEIKAAGALTFLNQPTGITATVGSGTLLLTGTLSNTTPQSTAVTCTDLILTITGTSYRCTGAIQYTLNSTGGYASSSGELVVDSAGIRIGRLFADPATGALRLEADGVVKPLPARDEHGAAALVGDGANGEFEPRLSLS